MKVITVLCLVILSHQKISASYLRLDNSGKSSLSTEYQARFQQRHCDGVNVSEGNIEGNHRFEKSTNEEPWESFASKCASIIHGLVAALTSAVAPAPGDAMNLELDIKNHIFHHDDRQFNACKPAGALPNCGNVPSAALAPPGIPVGGQTLTYPPDGGFLPPMNNYLGTDAVTLGPGIVYCDDVLQLPQSQPLEGSVGYLPVEASPAPEPTMNTPCTHEASCETTTPNFSSVPDFQNPPYAVPNADGLPNFDAQNKLIDGSPSFPADVLPLDNWKPCPNHQTDLISPGTALTDDCSSTSPHLAPGFVTPASLPPRTLCSNTLAWERFYNEHPELLSPNSPPKSRSCSPTDNPPWSSGFEWETPNQELDYLPPSPINADPFNPLTSDSLVTPVSPVTKCPPADICQGEQLPYLPPVDDNNSFPEIIPGDNFGTPNASGNDCLPGDTYANQQPGFVPPFDGTNDLPNIMPGDNFGPPLGSGNDFTLDGTFSNEQPGYFPEIEGAEVANARPGDFGVPAGPGTECPPEDNYPDPQQGYLPPGSGYGDGVLPGQYISNPAGAPAGAPLENTFPQQPEYLPPPSFNSAPPGIIPSDSLVTQTAPIPDFPLGDYHENQQPGLPPPLPFDDSSLPGQNTESPLTDNWSPYPSQQLGQLPPQPLDDGLPNDLPGQGPAEPVQSGPLASNNNWGPYPNQQLGQLPPQPFNDEPSNAIPGQNLDGPMESGPLAGNNLDPNQQFGQLPPQQFNDGLSNNLPGQGPADPMQPAPVGSDNWGPYPNQQFGQPPPQPLDDGLPNNLPGQGPAEPVQSGPLANNNWGPFPNQQLGQLPPRPFNDGLSNNLPGQDPADPVPPTPVGTENWGPYPNQLPGDLVQPVNGDSPYPVPGQNLDGPMESGPLAGNNWDPNQQFGQLPPQQFNDGLSNNLPGQGPADPVQSGPLASNKNWGPFPNQQPGQIPPQPFNADSSNALPEQNPDGPMESAPFGSDNWGPYPSQLPGKRPPQSVPQPVNGGSPYPVPGQNLDGPMESGPLAGNNWNPNQQPGQLPPQPFNDGLSNNLPGQGPADPVQPGPVGSDNWGPYPEQQPGSFNYPPFNERPNNHLPGNDFPEPPCPEPDNSLEGNNWDGSPHNQPDNLYGMNGPTKFTPGDNIEAPVPQPGMNSGNGQQPPRPSDSEGFNGVPFEPTPPDQTVPDDIATEPTFNGPNTPDYYDNGYGPGPADSGYNPIWNKEPSGVNYPAGNGNVEAEEPMIPPGMFEPPALESANQVSDESEQAGPPGFSDRDPGQYPEGDNNIPESTAPVPEYITPAYDDVIPDYNPEMEYQGPEDYGPGMNAAPNGGIQKPIQVPPRYQNGLPQAKPNYYGVPNQNQGWSPNAIYNHRPEYGAPPAAVDPSAIYIPVDPEQSIMLTDPNQDQDSDEFCSCDDCYYDDIVDHKAFRKTACRDLEEARDELKAIFDKIKKKLKCTQKKCFTNMLDTLPPRT